MTGGESERSDEKSSGGPNHVRSNSKEEISPAQLCLAMKPSPENPDGRAVPDQRRSRPCRDLPLRLVWLIQINGWRPSGSLTASGCPKFRRYTVTSRPVSVRDFHGNGLALRRTNLALSLAQDATKDHFVELMNRKDEKPWYAGVSGVG